MTTILTFSDIVSHSENMYHFGYPSGTTFRNEDILKMYNALQSVNTELHNIKTILPRCLYDIDDVYLLIVRNYFSDDCCKLNNIFCSPENIDNEGFITGVEWDGYRIHKNKTVENTINRSLLFMNLNYDYKIPFNLQSNHGTIYNILKIPLLIKMNNIFEQAMYGPLLCEAYNYPNKEHCYSPMKKENNRSKIIKVCVGESTCINFRWYKQSTKVSDIYSIQLNNGDLCIFSDSAIGFNKDKKTCLHVKYSIGINPHCLN